MASPAGPEPRRQKRGWEALVLDSLVLEELPGLSIRERMLGMNVRYLVRDTTLV